MEAQELSKNQIIQELCRSPHGKLEAYVPVGTMAARREPEFFAHLIAWNHEHGSIRDAKVALPVLQLVHLPTLAIPTPYDKIENHPLVNNALAHLAMLDPRNFVRALDFVKSGANWSSTKHQRAIKRLVERYLRHREQSFGLWERVIIQHRASMKTLYARFHVKPGAEIFDKALFKRDYPSGSTLDIISKLPKMPPKEALGFVLQRKIPFLIAIGALGDKLTDSDTVLALINSMSASELTTNAKMFERLGIRTNAALRAAYQDALRKAAEKAPREALLKTSKAAAAVADEGTRKAFAAVQEKQIAKSTVKGRWLVIGDKSGSMANTIEIAKEVAATLAKFAERCYLVFVDSTPGLGFECTGMTLEQIQEKARYVTAGGGTAMGVGLDWAMRRGYEFDGVAVVTDCEDGNPNFLVAAYQQYCKLRQSEPTLYVFRVSGGWRETLLSALKHNNVLTEVFDLKEGFDFYSLPNIVATLSTRRYGLIDKIMDTPLKTLDQVFNQAAERG